MQRAALYIRVSTEEQALYGYSLNAQKEALTKYANTHNMTVAGYYIDDGYSARKKYTSRKEFMRMLDDVKKDKLDIILFIKLDRFFRSVKDYYKIQEILEAHNVGWKTTEENYDTTTTNGRLYINIRLSVAQDESDRTSDRIKFVFDNKVTRGEVITGSQPMGFKIENKKLVHDYDKTDMIRDMFEYFVLHRSKYAVMRYIYDKYGIATEKVQMKNMLTNTLYIGEYRGNKNYCEPVIDKELFLAAQDIIFNGGIRQSQKGRVYIFSGMLRCFECNHIFCGNYCKNSGREYIYYRCNFEANLKTCKNSFKFNEQKLEKLLLEQIAAKAMGYIIDYHSYSLKSKPKKSSSSKRKLIKLKELYLNGLISLEEYRTDYEIYSAKPEETEAVQMPDLKNIDFTGIYGILKAEQRQALWRSIIKEIRIDSSGCIRIFLY